MRWKKVLAEGLMGGKKVDAGWRWRKDSGRWRGEGNRAHTKERAMIVLRPAAIFNSIL